MLVPEMWKAVIVKFIDPLLDIVPALNDVKGTLLSAYKFGQYDTSTAREEAPGIQFSCVRRWLDDIRVDSNLTSQNSSTSFVWRVPFAYFHHLCEAK